MGKLKNLIKAQAVRLLGYQKPDPKVWVFSSTDNCHYNYNSRYLFEYVLGIQQKENSVRYEKVVIEPCCMDTVREAEGHITTVSGVISVKYDETGITVFIPKKTEASLIMDGKEYSLISGKQSAILK